MSFELIHKPIKFIAPKTNKEKRRSEVAKNELIRDMLDTCKQVKFSWVLFDIGSKENFEHNYSQKRLYKCIKR